MIGIVIFTLLSSVTGAVFYPNQILVREVARFTANKSRIVEIADLPGDLDRSSFRVYGEGILIGEVTLVEIYQKEPKGIKVKRLIHRIDSLEESIKAIDDRVSAFKAKEEFLKSIKVTIPKKLSGDLYKGEVNAKEWQEAMGFIFDGAVDIKAEIRGLNKTKKKILEEIGNLREQLYRIAPYYKKNSYTARIEVTAKTPGTHKLGLEYLIGNGGWRPYYEFRPAGDKLEIGCFGKVIQRSGRDWQGIKVELTTARPAIGTTPPPLTAWYLRVEEPYVYDEEAPRAAREKAAMPAATSEVAKKEMVRVEEVGTAVRFKIPKSQTIKTGDEKKIPIVKKRFPARMTYFAAPRVAPFVYLKAELENGYDFPLLSGRGSIYSGELFTGMTTLGHTAPGESLRLFIGPDEQIKAKRELIRRFKKTKGVFKKREAIEYLFRITVENFRKDKIDLILTDQVPVSTDAEIKIRDVKIEPLAKPDEQGIIKWPVELKGNEKKKFEIGYTIEYPKGKNIIGLP